MGSILIIVVVNTFRANLCRENLPKTAEKYIHVSLSNQWMK